MTYQTTHRAAPPNHQSAPAGITAAGPRAAQLRALSDAVNAPIQRRTTHAQQTTIAANIDYILQYTTPLAITNLSNRVTFGANVAADQATILTFAGHRAAAETVRNGFGNVFAFNQANNFTNYRGDDLDAEVAAMQGRRDAIAAVRGNNTQHMVDQRKTAMINAVATAAQHQSIRDSNGGAFRDATTLANAQAALDGWEQAFFTVSRSAIIQAAKTGAHNGGGGAASVWQGISANVGGHATHMTVYNADIGYFAGYYVTRAATNQAASNAEANRVLPNGAGQFGVHLTADAGLAHNPRVFGNPPDAARYYNPQAGIAGNDFVGPLTNAQDTVRGYVWNLISTKLAFRP